MEHLLVNTFNGSLVDNVAGADPKAWEKCDNLVITDDLQLRSRPGYDLHATRVALPTTASYRIGALIPYKNASNVDAFLRQASERLFKDEAAVELVGPASNRALNSITSHSTEISHTTWKSHTFVGSGSYQKPILIFNNTIPKLVTSGLPRPANTTGAVYRLVTDSAVTYPYICAFLYKYTYIVNGVTFIHRGSPRYFRRAATTAPSTLEMADFDLVNANNKEHYDVADVNGSLVIEYYRTTNAGTVLYKVGETANFAHLIIADGIADAALVLNETLYTTGGVADNDRPPECKYVHATNDFCYYANGKDVVSSSDTSGQTLTSRIWQSKPGQPQAVPSEFNTDVDGETVGLSSVKGTPIVVTNTSVYRIDGNFDEYGRGGIRAEKIADFTGGAGNLSFVQTLDKLYFAGTDGFYETDGFSVRNISAGFTTSYKAILAYNSPRVGKEIRGAYNDKEKTVLWAIRNNMSASFPENAGENSNNGIFVYKIPADAFTTWSSGYAITRGDSTLYTTYQDQFHPTALAVVNGNIYFSDHAGYSYIFRESLSGDVNMVTYAASTDASNYRAIVYDYISSSFDNNIPNVRKYGSKIVIKVNPTYLTYVSNVGVNISTDTDGGTEMLPCADISTRSLTTWGSAYTMWGDEDVIWGHNNQVQQHGRRFPANKLRYAYRKVGFTNAFVNKWNSDLLGTGVLTDLGATATLVSAAFDGTTGLHSQDLRGYYVAFEYDGYEANYLITSALADGTLTISKSVAALSTDPAAKWIVRGFDKASRFRLIEWGCYFMPLTDTYAQYRGVVGSNV